MALALNRQQMMVLGAGAGLLAVVLGVRQVLGLYLVPMTIDLGWSREIFGIAMGLQNLVWGASQPFIGGLADRYGSGRVIVAGAICYALGVLGMASAITPTELLISGGILIGLGMSGVGMAVVYGAVARMVAPEKRTYAMAIVSTIGALGPFLLPPVTQVVIGGFGWEVSLLATAGVVALMIPLGALIRGKAENEAGAAPQSWVQALGEARKNRGYVLLVAGFFVCGFHVTFIGTHLPGFIAWCGLAAGVGGWALFMIGGGNIVGTYAAGLLSNRFRQKNLLSLIYLARAALIARGYAEMLRFGQALGGQRDTLSGLCGLGDLVLTCSSTSSRNFSLGKALGEGKSAAELMADRKTVAEGAHTAPVLHELAQGREIDMPIVEAVNAILGGATPAKVVAQLLARPLTTEQGEPV